MTARTLLTLCAAITADGKLDAAINPDDFPRQPSDFVFKLAAREDPTDRLQELWSQNRTRRVICFGDSTVFRRLFDAQLVTEIYLLVRPKIDGRRGAATLGGVPGEFFPKSVRCRLLKMEVCGQECLLHYRVLQPRAKRAVVA